MEKALVLTISVMWLWLGALGVLIGFSDASPQVLRRFTIMNLLSGGALIVLYAHYRIPPPLVSVALVEMMFALALVRQAIGYQK